MLRIVNRTRGTVVGSRIQVADGWWSRLRGYLGRPRPQDGEGILLVPCNAVHMFGMTYPLDVLFLDDRGRVIGSAPDLRPWRRSARVSDARYALELPVGTIAATRTHDGDELTWRPQRPGDTNGHHETLSSSRAEEGSSTRRSFR